MPGLNHVQAGGEPLTLDLSPGVVLTKVSVGPTDNNAYLLRSGGRAVLIDAAADAAQLIELIGSQPVDTIVTTHRHPDHWQALGSVAEATSARLVCGEPDERALRVGTKLSGFETVWDGDRIALGEEELEVIGLVGHTPGSVALVFVGGGVAHLFTGDSLFPGGPGKTGTPEEFTSLMDDLETKVFARFGDDTVVHPGHGDDTTLGAERAELPGWRARGW